MPPPTDPLPLLCDICRQPGVVCRHPSYVEVADELGVIDHSINDECAIVHRSCWHSDPEAHVWTPLDEVTVLFINRSDSKCGWCGYAADPRERRHMRRLGYGIEPGARGCRRQFTHLSSDYVGADAALSAQRLAPTLIWVELPIAHRVAALLKESANG